MPAELSRVETIFNEALAIAAPQERAALLDRACGTDADLRQRVDALLAAHDGATDVLQLPYSQRTVEPVPVILEGPGTIIGRYKLLERIGEGGFGVVYMAEQQHPVRRKVALKVIKPGFDTGQVIARFEAERQALALMDHENIARVLDAGATDSGRPYFVMELVHGVPITQFCDSNQLSPRQRLELFVPVCRAVQHAHTKRIIHRDIKPTNVLVTLQEGVPVPKVIDFGIAKATGHQLTERTLFTQFAQMIGTPLYMSPEQAEMSGTDIDTRSDVYSLGVLLYELLTGTTPLDSERLKKAAFDEVRRIIREEEPQRPSTRLSTLGERAQTISAQRKSDPKHLGQFVRGELDWIVMKALEKDRRRRYETASGLARDVQRYLDDEPVEACPASAGYKLRKFARKNRTALVTAAAFLVLLGTAAVVSTWQAIRATRAEAAAIASARQARDEANNTAVALAAEQQARQDEAKARQQAFAALRSMTDDVVEQKFARATVLSGDDRAFLRGIITQYDAFATIKGDDPESQAVRAEGRLRVGLMRYRLGELTDAEVAYRDAGAVYETLAARFPARPEFRQGLARIHANLGLLLRDTGRPTDSEAVYRQALTIRKQLVGESPDRPEFRQELANNLNQLSILLNDTGRATDAEAGFREALALNKALAAELPDRPEFRQDLATTYNNLAVLFRNMDRNEAAETPLREALVIRKQLVAEFPTRPDFRRELAAGHNNIANSHYAGGRVQDAEAAYHEALAIRKQLAADFPAIPEFRVELARNLNNLGLFLQFTGRPTDAEPAFQDALALQRALAADFPSRPDLRNALASTLFNLSVLCNVRHDYSAAKAYLEQAEPHHQAALKANPRQPDYRLAYRNYLCALAVANARLNDPSAVVRAAETLRDVGWNPADDAYSAACALARCAARVQVDGPSPAEERARAVRLYGEAATNMLRDAVSKGYKDLAQIKKDTELEPLRQREDFQKVVAELEAQPNNPSGDTDDGPRS